MDTVKRDPCLAVCFVINILSFKWMEREGERMENLLINAEHNKEATQRETSSETKLRAKW